MQNPQKGVAGWEAHHKVAEAASQPGQTGRIEAVRRHPAASPRIGTFPLYTALMIEPIWLSGKHL
jgi:hypothetical protein